MRAFHDEAGDGGEGLPAVPMVGDGEVIAPKAPERPGIEPDADAPLNLTQAETEQLRGAAKNGPGAMKDAWQSIHDSRRADAPAETSDPGPEAEAPDLDMDGLDPGDVNDRATLDRALAEVTHGVISSDVLDLVDHHAAPHSRKIDMILADAPNEEAAGVQISELAAAGYDRIVSNIYGGSEASFTSGLGEIDAALDALPDGLGSNLREQLNGSLALADLPMHLQVLGIARTINRVVARNRKPE